MDFRGKADVNRRNRKITAHKQVLATDRRGVEETFSSKNDSGFRVLSFTELLSFYLYINRVF